MVNGRAKQERDSFVQKRKFSLNRYNNDDTIILSLAFNFNYASYLASFAFRHYHFALRDLFLWFICGGALLRHLSIKKKNIYTPLSASVSNTIIISQNMLNLMFISFVLVKLHLNYDSSRWGTWRVHLRVTV